MLDLNLIRNHPELVRRKLNQRHIPAPLDEVQNLDRQRRDLLQKTEQLKHRRNQNNDAIIALKKTRQDAAGKIAEMKELSRRIKQLDEGLRSCEEKLRGLQLTLPNLAHDSVPVGADASDNVEIRVHGEKPRFDFQPQPHWDLGHNLGILDLERAAKIAGARFSLYAGLGARMERALINFMLDVHTQDSGYLEVLPPFMANSASLTGTGQLPKFSGDLFPSGRDRPLAGSHGRGPSHQHFRERNLEGGATAASADGLHSLLPQRSRSPRQGHARTHSPAPVQQSGTG